MKNVALILASGTGSRCGLEYPKQFAEINGKTVLEHAIGKFQTNKFIDEIYIVTNSEYVERVSEISKIFPKVVDVVAGGKTRKDSSYNGVSSIRQEECNVLIHDGVRPLITDEVINRCIYALEKFDAVCVVTESVDTVYITDNNGKIMDIPNRDNIKCAQTPQCFKLSLIKKAHSLAETDSECKVTDDCGLVKRYNLSDIMTVDGDEKNIKITYQADIDLASKYLC